MRALIDDTGNGVVLRTADGTYRFDPVRAVQGDVNIVSHAHSDHAPSRFGKSPVCCSDATFDLLRLRRRTVARACPGRAVLREAGHVPGSRMALVEGDARVLYTGDFCTRRKGHLDPAEPCECDVLVTETTYGKEGYEFPDHEETVGAIVDWVDATLASGRSAVLLAYPLGKAQELAYELRGRPVRVQGSIGENNRVLRAHGFQLTTDGVGDMLPREPFVYITSGLGKEKARVRGLVNQGARTAAFSGWSVGGFGARPPRRADEEFPLSDHCDFNELMEFVRLCRPSLVLSTHGFAAEFSRSVRKELGIEARPIVRGQVSLDAFA